MRLRRIALVVAVLGSLAAAGVALTVWLTPADPINERNLARIRPGLPEHDVETILGGPAGVYTNRLVTEASVPPFMDDGESKSWVGNECEILVRFNADGVVTQALLLPSVPVDEPILERVLRWLHLR